MGCIAWLLALWLPVGFSKWHAQLGNRAGRVGMAGGKKGQGIDAFSRTSTELQ